MLTNQLNYQEKVYIYIGYLTEKNL